MSKIVILGDVHAGVHNASEMFMEFQCKYLNEVIDYCVEHNIKDVWQTGDMFETRKPTHTTTLDYFKKNFFDRLEELDIHMKVLTGNHDCPKLHTLKPNALTVNLSSYKNITIFDEPTEVKINDKNSVLMVPWICRDNEVECMDMIRTSKCNVVLGHFECKGARMSGAVCEEGLELSEFDRYDLALSGHFHVKGVYGKMEYVGTPYETSWADYGEKKGIHTLDTETLELEFIPNHHRMYYKLHYNDDKDMSVFLKNDYTNCYVRAIVEQRDDSKFKEYESWLMRLEVMGMKDLKCIEPFGDASSEDSDIEFDGTIDVISTSELIDGYISDVYPERHKKLNAMAQGLLGEALRVMQ